MKRIDYSKLYTLRSDGRYMGYYRDATGKRKALYDRDPRALYEKLAAANERASTEPTFADIADAWKTEKWDGFREGTRQCYKAALDKALEWSGDTLASQVEPSDIYELLCSLRSKDYSKKTLATVRTVYSVIYDAAIVDQRFTKWVRANPARSCSMPKGIKAPQKRSAPEDDIVDRIRANASKTEFGLFALFLISTGFRRGEALGIRWCDIDMKQKTISCEHQYSFKTKKIEQPKTENGKRVVPILPDLYAELSKLKPGKRTDYLFGNDDPQKPLTESKYRTLWEHYCREMDFVSDGKPSLTAHCMRHGYATLLFDAGVDEYTAQVLCGHSDIRTTMAIYTHLRQRKRAGSIDKLKQYVEGQMSASVVSSVVK